ncbi:MAG: phenylalanine--tRNA ligase subunit beta [Candidatus Dormibacteraeota bacterium]|nr:phenylalanine--tRNA ligase subunit beta [Candidatus Dormibacteraeota bacterium]
MRYSLGWLKDYVDLPDRQALIDRLTRAGSEVERVIDQGLDFEGVIVARVDGLRPHPNADKLQLALVATGGSPVEVVTGATNLAVGDCVPLAVTGARLKERRIERQVFRGIPSEGMLCSAIELGVGEDAAGILILDPSAVPGEDVRELFPADTILEVEIKSNRPDLLCHLGIAREISALFSVPLRPPTVTGTAVPSEPLVRLESARACRRFVVRRFTGIKVGPSPVWLQARLRAAGVRPISNVVDITNYVMLELGQPMHAFDQRRLDGPLVVRQARPDERLPSLDGKTWELRPEDIVVADGARALALAGIIGGADSAVDASTTDIVLEAATWEPRQIRASSRTHGVRTEASSRFEKGLSPAISLPAIERATTLIGELAGGRAVGHGDVYPDPFQPVSIELSAARIDRVLGLAIPLEAAATILERLAFAVRLTGDSLMATPPDFRLDCTIPEDLVEEIGRIYGYDRVPSTVPGRRMPVRDLYQPQDVDEIARDLLVGLAFDEALTNSLVSDEATADIRLPAAPAARARLRNPMVENRNALRASLLPGLLDALALNARQDQPGARLVELGTVVWKGEEGVKEPRVLGIAVHVPGGAEPALAGLREVQQALAALRDRVSLPPVTFPQGQGPGWHPGRTAEIRDDNGAVGIVGEVHPSLLAALGLPGRAVGAEVLFDRFVELGQRTPRARALPRFPGIRRDITVVIRGHIAAGQLVQVMQRLSGYTLREISMLTEYQGPQLEAGARSLSFRLQFQADDRTLTSEEVSATYQRVVDGLKQEFDAEVRA